MRKIFLTLLGSFLIVSLSFAQRQFWGTCSQGGDNGDGFIFRTDSIGDNLEIVHHFKNEIDGTNISALLLASNNKLYGMASAGGELGNGNVFAGGTLFEYDLTTNQFKVVQHFGVANTALPGIVTPRAEGVPALTEITPGVLYGLMRQGEYVFAYNINTGVFTKPFTVPTFTGGTTNSVLQNKINQAFIKASDGNFYATTATNSSCPTANPNSGSVMRLNTTGTTLTIPHRASCLVNDGYIYKGFLTEVNGRFYGATDYGGVNNKGVIFDYNYATNTYTKRYDLGNSVYSYEPKALILGTNGKLYGVAHGGGTPEASLGLPAGGGVLFEFDPATNAFAVKHSFTIAGQSIYDLGIFPTCLINSKNGKVYGATQYGVFEYNTATDHIRVAGRFNGLGFAPSMLQLCHKPAYQQQSVTSYAICEGAAFTFDVVSTNANTVTWKHNGVTDATKTSTVLSFSAFSETDAGTWVCTLTNECGSTDTQTITLTSGDPEKPVIATGGSLTFCDGENVLLSAPEGYGSYVWSNGSITREITVDETGSYSVSVGNGCMSPESEAVEVVVNDLPSTPEITKGTDDGITLIASGSSSGQYDWLLNDVLLGIHTDKIMNPEPGVYQVYSVSEEDCRSAEAASMIITVTGIESAPDDVVVLYPNPGKGKLTVNVRASMRGTAHLRVLDATGRMVHTQRIVLTDKAQTLDLQNLSSGLYHLVIQQDAGVVVKKFVIQ